MIKYLILFLSFLFLWSCEPTDGNRDGEKATDYRSIDSLNLELENLKAEEMKRAETPSKAPPPREYNASFPYKINQPNRTFKLKSELTEISGLSMAANPMLLVANNDEKGEVYFIDKNTGFEEYEIDFGKGRDYEGIETVGDNIYVVESDGEIYRIEYANTKDQDTDELDGRMGRSYNVEGLTYDGRRDLLLLACKGKAGSGDEYDGQRAIYGYDLEKMDYTEEPVFLIDRNEIAEWLGPKNKHTGVARDLIELLDPDAAADAFAPSGISIHPRTGHLYILSSVGKLLVVLNQNGKIIHIEALDKSIHRQPEGICFEKDGTLYIANEGKGGRGRIHKFKPVAAW